MRHRDRREAAQFLDGFDRRAIQMRRAVPEDIALGSPHYEGALADADFGIGMDGVQVRLFIGDRVVILAFHLRQRGPLLAVPAAILPLVFAAGAIGWWSLRWSELDTAGYSDKVS